MGGSTDGSRLFPFEVKWGDVPLALGLTSSEWGLSSASHVSSPGLSTLKRWLYSRTSASTPFDAPTHEMVPAHAHQIRSGVSLLCNRLEVQGKYHAISC